MSSRELVALTRAECLGLLAEHDFGRVVASTGAGTPIIRPVNYRFDPATQCVVFRTLEGSKFHALVHSTQASFEIDARATGEAGGWSVIVTGHTEEVTQPREVERLSRLGVEAWLDGTPRHWVRIRARTV